MQNPQQFWDTKYADKAYIYGTQPNQFFKESLQQITTPGRILLLAEGEGRNAVFAAQMGWQVTAIDFSEKGREKALELAELHNVQIDYQIMDIRDFRFEDHEPWEAIGLIYAHFPPIFRTEIHQKCLAALRPDGQIILEAFNPEQLRYSSGGPKDVAMLYTPDLLRADFAEAAFLELSQVETTLQEGPGHDGPASVVRCVVK